MSAVRNLAAAMLWLFMPGASVAATVTGTVVTAGASPSAVLGARVILFDQAFTMFLETRTDWLGRYQLQAPPGSYSVGVAARDYGYQEDAYSPPYLFRGPRPRIDQLSKTTLARGETFTLDVSLAPAVTSVILIGTQATTHYVDGAVPRRLALSFSQTGGRLEATSPAAPIVAPEGYYLLFVMVDDVPSEGRLVRLDPAAASPPPDQIGGALTVDAAGAEVVVDWRHGPLNPSRYNVYRSTVAADLQLIPTAIGTRSPVASVDVETWADPVEGPAAGQAFFYRVLGRNCDGSVVLP